MGTSVWRPIRAELRRITLTVPGVSAYQWELKPYKAGEEPIVPWLADRIEKGNGATATLGTWGMVEERGIYLLSLNWPRTGLEADGEDLADAIRLAFWHGREITGTGPDVLSGTVLATHARTAIPLETKTVFPVRVEFYFRRKTAQGRAA